MRAGALNKRVELQYKTTVPDGMGGFTATWVIHAVIWASITPLSSHRKTEAMQQGLNATHEIKTRYRSILKGSWRIKYGNRYFSIGGFTNPKEANKELIITCLEAA